MILRCYKFIFKLFVDKYVSLLLFKDIELIWYVCVFVYICLGLVFIISLEGLNIGIRNVVIFLGFFGIFWLFRRLKLEGV